MAGTIRVKVKGGLLEPLETIETREGEVLTITVMRLPTAERAGGLERSAGGWKGLIDTEELKRNIPADHTPFARWLLEVQGSVSREHRDA
jgi:hypothetical protein